MKTILYIAATLGLGLSPTLSHAQSWIATGTGPFSWEDGVNWSGGTVPNTGNADAIFSNAANPDSFLVNVNTAITVNSLLFNANQTGNVTLGGSGSLTLSANGNIIGLGVANGSGQHIINVPVFIGGSNNPGYRNWLVSDGQTLTVNGTVGEVNSRAISKSGNGTLILTADNTFTGGFNVLGGTVYVNNTNITTGSGTGSGNVFVTAALIGTLPSIGKIGGTGRIGGALGAVGNDGLTATVAPGTATGVGTLTVGNGVALGAGSELVVRLNGATPGTYDRLTNSAGNVVLTGNPTLNASRDPGYIPAINDKLFIVVNSGAGTTTGTFNGLAEGATVNLSGFEFVINYGANFEAPGQPLTGGNDIALTPVPEPATCLGLAVVGGLALRTLRRRARS